MRRTSQRRTSRRLFVVRCLFLLLASLVLLSLFTEVADARVGGGGSYSGGGGGGSYSGGGGGSYSGGGSSYSGGSFSGGSFSGSSYSGGSSSGGGGGSGFGVVLVLACVFVGFLWSCLAASDKTYSSAKPSRHSASLPDRFPGFAPGDTRKSRSRKKRNQPDPRLTVEKRLSELRSHDPNFSEILFMDFAYTLYAKAHEARGNNKLDNYSTYLTKTAITTLLKLNSGSGRLKNVRGVIVGGAQITKVTSPRPHQTTIRVRFETNYTERRKGTENSFYCEEIWNFSRQTRVLSPPPERICALGCPRCGSASKRNPNGSCGQCGAVATAGKYHWVVTGITVVHREARGPLLTSDVLEVGTGSVTLLQRDYSTARAKFVAVHPDFQWQRTQNRFRHIFMELQQAWSTLKWERARPYESDQIFQFHQFWIHEYQKQRLRNVLEDTEIERLQPVKFKSDAFYDAITVRIWASMKDFTVDERNTVVCGDKHHDRRFTEYWTFIRRHGVKESSRKDSNCPNCGGPLKINMSGICDYCDSRITSGEFDWVLSLIEQDEAYAG